MVEALRDLGEVSQMVRGVQIVAAPARQLEWDAFAARLEPLDRRAQHGSRLGKAPLVNQHAAPYFLDPAA